MNLTLEKERIKQKLDQVNDENIILIIKKALGLVKDPQLLPLTKEDIIARAVRSEDDIKNGRFVTLEELENEMKDW